MALASAVIERRPPLDAMAIERPLRIALLGYRSHPYCGGQGVYLRFLSKALVEAGHSVDVISGPPYPQLDPRVRLVKLPSLDLFAQTSLFPHASLRALRDPINRFEYWGKLTGGFVEPETFGRRLVHHFRDRRQQYDLVHDNQSLCYGLLQLQQWGIPTVTTIHHPITRDLEIALDSARNGWHRLLIRRWHSFLTMQKAVARELNHLVTVSECSRRDIAEAFGLPIESINLVYNGIDTDEFRPCPELPREPFQIMATASADAPLKGLDHLLEAISRLVPDYPALRLVVLGQPKPGGHTERLIERLRLADRVRFVRGLSTAEVAQLYARSTLAVVPSLYEGFGLPAGEAMACGVPVISTTGGALPEVVGDAGVLVPPGDAVALASAIAELLEDPARREELGEAARRRIEQQFSWQVTARQMTDYYQTLLTHADR
ncbi:MAG TPA: glycosyltransferase family 4 protein [Pseudomonadales bacterium]|nr:glycosyltransferase family 4 protein [Pseudomonadales bacterium]HMW15185.1 glycosyltransferase family 4 protein [Pseudomonadales bacterium]HMZ70965.1 glycosyltransferase family 4 protein [Pseudomonadales bacterium]HMZ91719.1 glycosyltransferase family 4 protein [Pseudomonadales bacterium]HNB84112.1 glycosyltransferase family 4 protein [Pseudomonadales bacterium]